MKWIDVVLQELLPLGVASWLLHTSMHLLNVLLLLINQLEQTIQGIQLLEQLAIHTILHSCNKITRLYELPDGRPILEPLRNIHAHRLRYLLDLSNSVLIERGLRVVRGRSSREDG